MSEIAIVDAVETKEGEGAKVIRSFPTANQSYLDPFVLLDNFFVDTPHGFPQHPHRGFEAVTYMLQGSFIHKDTTGAEEEIHEGGVQRVNMGNGVEHSEMPGTDGTNTGLQLWVNLPKAKKDMDPDYQDAEADQLPVEETETARVKTVVGEGSPITLQTEIEYKDITVTGGSYTIQLHDDWTAFLYIISGSGTCDGKQVHDGQLVLCSEESKITVRTADEIRLVAIQGKPHNQEINQHGPFVD